MVRSLKERYLEMFNHNINVRNYFGAYKTLMACPEIARDVRVLDIIVLEKYFANEKKALRGIGTAVRLAEESKITLEGKAS